MTHTTEQTLIGNDNSPERVIADALVDHFHGGCEPNACACPPQNIWKDVAREVLEQLAEHFWIVGKVEHDANPHVRPYIRGEQIRREAADDTPESAEQYAAQLLAAAEIARANREARAR